ncbi:MAG: DUF2752 domain-containing protein [Limisphaerales bacterium]
MAAPLTTLPPVLPAAAPRPAGPRNRWLPWLVVAGAALLLFHERPAGQFFYPRCTLHQTTGLLCPGCGGTRAAHARVNGRVTEALRCNAAAVLGLPALLGAVAWRHRARRRRGLPPDGLPASWVWVITGALGLFGVLRNLPGEPWRWLGP